ncbi:MAG: hypothetical protein NC419_01815 [Muribaculaceae bacterium]|nr:hypothetical protein [Muribaculaceae bacterium]
MYKLQNILINGFIEIDGTRQMYYRGSDTIYSGLNEASILYKNNWFEFFTYFNSLSVEKWKKYTYAEKFYLVLEAEGKFTIDLFGHYGKKTSDIKKEWLGSYAYDLQERTQIILPYPIGMQSTVVAFQINSNKKTFIYDAYYAADINKDEIDNPYIALVTTTFKKESYVNRNIALLKEQIFSDTEYANAFCWNIIDNGQTLTEQTSYEESIRIFHNKNVGGAGGFARGMIESLRQPKMPTHILLMDDDVNVFPESFKRIYKLLSILKPEYSDYFVSGAMLNMDVANIQHENTGILVEAGYCKPINSGLDMNLWDSVVCNEVINDGVKYQYAAWWFCCIPTSIAGLDNLPVPVFVREDDVEYSIRNKARFITMNGICIWHEGFENKFSAALEFYQVRRNELIAQALNTHIKDVDFIGHIKQIFWEEIYKYNYKGASFLLDAVEDFLKGPDYIMSLDGEQCIKDKMAKDNKLADIEEKVEKYIKTETLYQYDIIGGVRLFLYNHTCNGQKRILEIFSGKGTGVIPYGWGYDKGKLAGNKIIYAVDLQNQKYATFIRSRKKFKELTQRYQRLMQRFEQEKDEISSQYAEYSGKMTNVAFWNEYLKVRMG